MCGRHGAGLDWPEGKDNFSNNILLIFAAIRICMSGAMLPIYYGASFLSFCQISGLKKAFEKIIKYQTALKFEFQEHASISDWPEDFHQDSYVWLFFLQQRFVQSYACCQSTWGHLPQLSAKFEPWMKYFSVFDMKQQYILKLILLRGITLFSTGIIS